MANGREFTEVWESDCGPGSSGKLACAHCDIYYSWGNGQSWPREANLNILIAARGAVGRAVVDRERRHRARLRGRQRRRRGRERRQLAMEDVPEQRRSGLGGGQRRGERRRKRRRLRRRVRRVRRAGRRRLAGIAAARAGARRRGVRRRQQLRLRGALHLDDVGTTLIPGIERYFMHTT